MRAQKRLTFGFTSVGVLFLCFGCFILQASAQKVGVFGQCIPIDKEKLTVKLQCYKRTNDLYLDKLLQAIFLLYDACIRAETNDEEFIVERIIVYRAGVLRLGFCILLFGV